MGNSGRDAVESEFGRRHGGKSFVPEREVQIVDADIINRIVQLVLLARFVSLCSPAVLRILQKVHCRQRPVPLSGDPDRAA